MIDLRFPFTMNVVGNDANRIDALVTSIRDSRLPSPSVRRQIRDEAGVTVREAAAAIGVAPMTYLRWEKGTVQPRRRHAIAYRRFLDELLAIAS